MAATDIDAVAAPFLKALAQALPPEIAEVLLPSLRLRANAGRLVVVVPNPVWRDVFHDLAADRLRTLLKPKNMTLQVVCRLDVANRSTTSEQRFTTFLQDPGNQLALTACRRAVEAPGLEHNPLYLYGPPGCGKSHLLTAVAAEYRSMLDEHAVVAFTGPDFVAREAQRLAERGSSPLRQRLEKAALILIDTIEALANRQLAQEELFHLINSALERGQQIVIAGSAAPRKLPGFEDRLVTRLAWGFSVAIEPLHAETRFALLRRLGDQAAADIPADELARLVDTFAPDMHQVVKLAERLREGERPGVGADYASFDRIVQVVADRYGLRPGDLSSKRRHREVAQARQVALLLGRRLTNHSLDALGGMIGGRDHSTVLYSIRQAEERVGEDKSLQRDVAEMTQRILDRDQDD
ncbi:MAG TPA: DnaA/Hda family protein [Planctomycetota bacterium]|nr:DnaA/Hda family protein [Planctomycetota bacterium]